jgi:hypothetical protein
MKKMIPASLLLAAIFILNACSKTYDCACDNGLGGKIKIGTVSSYSKKKAADQCANSPDHQNRNCVLQ